MSSIQKKKKKRFMADYRELAATIAYVLLQ